MPHEITMPQLGMAQDSGVIVAWHKRPGDAVAASDVLMEVETDKTTLEVEAGRDGFVGELRAEAGAEVPVGHVIALIVERAEDVRADESLPIPAPPLLPASVPLPEAPPAAAVLAPQTSAPVSDGRILASPKARYQAHLRGIDLERLVRQGIPQPFHVADLDRLQPEPATPAPTRVTALLRAEVDRTAFADLVDWMGRETDDQVNRVTLLAALACGAWRRTWEWERSTPVTVEITHAVSDLGAATFRDADLAGGLAAILPERVDRPSNLRVFDLGGTSLVEYRPGLAEPPALVVTETDPDRMHINLHFQDDVIALAKAATLLEAIAARLRDPVRHLL